MNVYPFMFDVSEKITIITKIPLNNTLMQVSTCIVFYKDKAVKSVTYSQRMHLHPRLGIVLNIIGRNRT